MYIVLGITRAMSTEELRNPGQEVNPGGSQEYNPGSSQEDYPGGSQKNYFGSSEDDIYVKDNQKKISPPQALLTHDDQRDVESYYSDSNNSSGYEYDEEFGLFDGALVSFYQSIFIFRS